MPKSRENNYTRLSINVTPRLFYGTVEPLTEQYGLTKSELFRRAVTLYMMLHHEQKDLDTRLIIVDPIAHTEERIKLIY